MQNNVNQQHTDHTKLYLFPSLTVTTNESLQVCMWKFVWRKITKISTHSYEKFSFNNCVTSYEYETTTAAAAATTKHRMYSQWVMQFCVITQRLGKVTSEGKKCQYSSCEMTVKSTVVWDWGRKHLKSHMRIPIIFFIKSVTVCSPYLK
jgi:hypothetical protein